MFIEYECLDLQYNNSDCGRSVVATASNWEIIRISHLFISPFNRNKSVCHIITVFDLKMISFLMRLSHHQCGFFLFNISQKESLLLHR